MGQATSCNHRSVSLITELVLKRLHTFEKLRRVIHVKTRRSPLLWKVIGGVGGLQVDPLAGGEVQPVQVCAVDVTCGPSKHVQVAVDDDHGLED